MTRRLRTFSVCAAALLGSLSMNIPAAADSKPHRPVRENYLLHCSGCHRLDGSGVPGVAPDLRKIGPLLETEAGRAYLGRVPGVAQAPVDDEELARLLNWVLTEIAGTAPQPAYTPREVGILRAEPLRDPVAARRALQIPDAPES
jgi:mono/diheme cytochrome c family protein